MAWDQTKEVAVMVMGLTQIVLQSPPQGQLDCGNMHENQLNPYRMLHHYLQ
jgi:hypothetical protein